MLRAHARRCPLFENNLAAPGKILVDWLAQDNKLVCRTFHFAGLIPMANEYWSVRGLYLKLFVVAQVLTS